MKLNGTHYAWKFLLYYKKDKNFFQQKLMV